MEEAGWVHNRYGFMVFWFRVWVIWFDKAENNGVEVVPWLVSINFFYGGDRGKERLVYGWKLIKSVWSMVLRLLFGGMKENQCRG